jgi:hypothetical protein
VVAVDQQGGLCGGMRRFAKTGDALEPVQVCSRAFD